MFMFLTHQTSLVENVFAIKIFRNLQRTQNYRTKNIMLSGTTATTILN